MFIVLGESRNSALLQECDVRGIMKRGREHQRRRRNMALLKECVTPRLAENYKHPTPPE
jgi:hypothetical protein